MGAAPDDSSAKAINQFIENQPGCGAEHRPPSR